MSSLRHLAAVVCAPSCLLVIRRGAEDAPAPNVPMPMAVFGEIYDRGGPQVRPAVERLQLELSGKGPRLAKK